MENQTEDRTTDERMEGGAHGEVMEKMGKRKHSRGNNKAVVWIVAIVVLLGLGWMARGWFIVATVNGAPISRLSVLHKLEQSSGKKVLTSMITMKLINDAAKARGIVITDEEINTEISTVEEKVKQQGGTLDALLTQQGLTLDEVKQQIRTQKEVEKMVGDKTAVTDTEVDAYITTNKLTIPAAQLAVAKVQIKKQLEQDKVGKEGQALVDDLLASAKITYFGSYK